MISIDITPQKIKIKIADYGEFEVTPLGAGAEATIRVANRKMIRLLEEAKGCEEVLKSADEAKKKEAIDKLNEANDALDDYRDIFVEKMKKVFKGDNVDALFDDFSEAQITEIYHKALANGRIPRETK